MPAESVAACTHHVDGGGRRGGGGGVGGGGRQRGKGRDAVNDQGAAGARLPGAGLAEEATHQRLLE